MGTIKARLSDWDFAARERELFESAKQIPTWRLANQSRRFLADVIRQLMEQIPERPPTPVDRVERRLGGQLAAVQLGAVVVRSAGAVIALIGCGYEREAFGQGRIQLECLIRLRQLDDDTSGAVARQLLSGRRPKALKSIAHRYGSKREIELLDRFSHADVLTLRTLVDRAQLPVTGAVNIELRPTRGQLRPASQLLESARTSVAAAAGMVEQFGVAVEVPGWISGQLKHYRDNPLPDPL